MYQHPCWGAQRTLSASGSGRDCSRVCKAAVSGFPTREHDPERDARDELKIIATENIIGAVAVRDKQSLEFRRVEHTLRLALALDAENPSARGEVDDLHRVLIGAERGGEQPVTIEIDAKVIHARAMPT